MAEEEKTDNTDGTESDVHIHFDDEDAEPEYLVSWTMEDLEREVATAKKTAYAEGYELATGNIKDAIDSILNSTAFFLDLVGPLEHTYTTKSGNKIRGRLDSP